ncbi:MAG: amylo-alpha-1,6-glucosidase [Lachnospiraceae bacterium]|nr:amylo-alpha-1,6-glucosidase [Lachnospiraceae bacterium]
MKTFSFTPDVLSNFPEAIKREWVLTNGIGGYAGSSIIGAHTRKHHGYLIASLHPPVERYVVFSKVNECIRQGADAYDLTTRQWEAADGSTHYEEGQKYLTSFSYDGLVHFTYKAGDITITKTLAFEHGKNTIAIGYELENTGADATLTLTPLFNYRVHSDGSTPEDLVFDVTQDAQTLSLTPSANPDITIRFFASEGNFQKNETIYETNMQLQTEINVEADCIDNNFTPYQVAVSLPAGCHKKLSVIGCIEADWCMDAFQTIRSEYDRLDALEKQAGYTDDFSKALVVAADQFLAYRQSTGLMTVLAGLPWFTDWGRDTMIALTGLTLATKRFDMTRGILTTFARYVKNGMVPNMFPDEGSDPLYNTVDASLWYFYAVDRYLKYTGADSDYAFVQETIYPKLKEILAAYENGTDFSIYMEDDCLIHAGSGLDQVTWMDVRVGDWVATPRHGKPVEINALWYNALKVMESLAVHFQEDAAAYRTLADKVQASFCKKFWNADGGYLYDVVDGDTGDASFRPNQIYAVSLPYRMLSKEQEKSVVDSVYEKLYVGCGLRSIEATDPQYHGIYSGCLAKRDAAYHQGTAWGFLLGGFVTAYVNVYGHDKDSIQKAYALFDPVKKHLSDGCIGSIAEIFDGDAPHTSRGCYGQAWSVGETLRAYTEDILPYMEVPDEDM